MNTTTLAHQFWRQFALPGDVFIDATCGNGKDTLFLAQLLGGHGKIIAYDIQKEAIEKASHAAATQLTEKERQTIVFKCQSHQQFEEMSAKGVVYNLGYLPGGNHLLTTQTPTTLKSLENATSIVLPNGFISITLYPGHLCIDSGHG